MSALAWSIDVAQALLYDTHDSGDIIDILAIVPIQPLEFVRYISHSRRSVQHGLQHAQAHASDAGRLAIAKRSINE